MSLAVGRRVILARGASTDDLFNTNPRPRESRSSPSKAELDIAVVEASKAEDDAVGEGEKRLIGKRRVTSKRASDSTKGYAAPNASSGRGRTTAARVGGSNSGRSVPAQRASHGKARASTTGARRGVEPRSFTPTSASRVLSVLESPLKTTKGGAPAPPSQGAELADTNSPGTRALSKRDKLDVTRALSSKRQADDRARSAEIKAATLREQLQKITDAHLLEKVRESACITS